MMLEVTEWLLIASIVLSIILFIMSICKLVKADKENSPNRPTYTFILTLLLVITNVTIFFKSDIPKNIKEVYAQYKIEHEEAYPWKIWDSVMDSHKENNDNIIWVKRDSTTYYIGYTTFENKDIWLIDPYGSAISQNRKQPITIKAIDSNNYNKMENLKEAKYIYNKTYSEGITTK